MDVYGIYGGGVSQTLTVSSFPLPPEYAELYTDENVKMQAVLSPPPVPNEYVVFGEEYKLDEEIIRSLQSQKMEQLYSDLSDWQNELKKLNRSTVSAFLDLLDVLIRCPDHPERRVKLENLRLLFINMHHLINEYRPVQAHETLKAIMKAKIESIKEMTVQLRELIVNGRKVLNEEDKALADLPEVDSDKKTESANDYGFYGNSSERWRKLAEEVAIERQARSLLAERQEALKIDVALCGLCDTYDTECNIGLCG